MFAVKEHTPPPCTSCRGKIADIFLPRIIQTGYLAFFDTSNMWNCFHQVLVFTIGFQNILEMNKSKYYYATETCSFVYNRLLPSG